MTKYWVGQGGMRECDFAFPVLAPPVELARGYQACIVIKQALISGELHGKKSSDLHRWINGFGSNDRRSIYAAALSFLKGRKLMDAKDIFMESYDLNSPQAWAALAWIASDPDHKIVASDDPHDQLGQAIVERVTEALFTLSLSFP